MSGYGEAKPATEHVGEEFRSARLLSSLPPDVATFLRPHAGRISAAIIQEIQQSVPAYAQPLRGTFGRTLVEGVEQAVLHCLDCLGNPSVGNGRWVEFFRARGRFEFHHRHNMDALQAAARVGGRAAWRYISALITPQIMEKAPDLVSVCAEGILAFVDELSATALEGYHAAQAEASGAGEHSRRQLLELILAGTVTAPLTMQGLACAAGWSLPELATVVVLRRTNGSGDLAWLEHLEDVLSDTDSMEPILLTTDPQRDLAALSDGRVTGWHAAVSPPVPLAESPSALRTARRALRLLGGAATETAPVIWCQDHLATLWILAEDFFPAEVAKRSLDPLDALTEKQRERLGDTLLAWLETRGGAPEIARRLQVHPQTVRSRMHQLKDLFGDRLDDADDRLSMHLALRAQRLLRTMAESSPEARSTAR
ncbi:PucR family transcriptional regulator [Amycolatopsis palatopharyngis]|uniref:PucR family transcriptional regulator n=1 Tax=Amycolatopsis palatopharyngis TaxID=187982 RepID=UPI001FEAC416|nr:PucR family transcriptional regulator [Amycolatopsis palatopharyngis]